MSARIEFDPEPLRSYQEVTRFKTVTSVGTIKIMNAADLNVHLCKVFPRIMFEPMLMHESKTIV